jgi:hypothetical protein
MGFKYRTVGEDANGSRKCDIDVVALRSETTKLNFQNLEHDFKTLKHNGLYLLLKIP